MYTLSDNTPYNRCLILLVDLNTLTSPRQKGRARLHRLKIAQPARDLVARALFSQSSRPRRIWRFLSTHLRAPFGWDDGAP